MKLLTRGGRKFLFAGQGLSLQTGKYFGESVLVGMVTGIVVVAFRYGIDLVRHYVMEELGHHRFMSHLAEGRVFNIPALEHFADPHRWLLMVLPAIGAALGYLLIKVFTSVEHARGTGSAIWAYHNRNGYLPATVIPVKGVASLLTVGFGGSAGYEGPVTLIGSACGSTIGRLLNLTVRGRRIMMAAGLAAGIAALFQAPLAGAMFGFEVFYSSSDVEYETILPCFIASAVSYSIFGCFFGWSPLFEMPHFGYENGLWLFMYFILALVVTYGARFYISTYNSIEHRFKHMRIPGVAKVALGGLFTGVVGFFMPDILGSSYSMISASLQCGYGHMFEEYAPVAIAGFIGFFFVKTLTTAFTVGSGGSGGLFAPALVCGGALGASVGLFFDRILPESFGIHPAAFALVGMAGFLASTIRIPMTAILIVAEISGNHALLVPAMWVCGISFWLNNGWALYRTQPHNRESSPVHSGKST